MFKKPSPVAVGLLIVVCSLVRPTPAAAQSTWYVDVSVCPNAGTGTEADPFCRIQDGITAAANGDTVLVLPGTYHEAIDYLDRQIVVASRDGAEATTIDGSGLGRPVVTMSGGQSRETVLDGFRIAGGEAQEDPFSGSGSGIRCIGSSPTISHCTFVGGDSGRVMLNLDGDPSVMDCLFLGNDQGSIHNVRSAAVIARCVFQGCHTSQAGGAIYNDDGSQPSILGSRFEDCTTQWLGGAILDDGAGANITNCEFVRNNAWSGAAVYSRTNTTIVGCAFVRNIAWTGGAVFSTVQTEIRHCTFRENDARVGGGAIYLQSGGAAVADSIFLGNTSIDPNRDPQKGLGGSIFSDHCGDIDIVNTVFVGNTALTGGVFYEIEGQPRFKDSTFVANRAVLGNSVADASGGRTFYFHNSILWGNVPRQGGYAHFGVVAQYANCVVQGGLYPEAVDEGGNISTRPRFARMPFDGGNGWADDLGTPYVDERDNNDYGDLRLLGGSPGIDAGRNDLVPSDVITDFDGFPRFVHDGCTSPLEPSPRVDMGAFEFQAPQTCGDGVCGSDESCATCPCDCGDCCGNGTCDSFESCRSCAEDCDCRALHVPDDYPSIQDAIDAAEPADEVVVAPGTYVENIDFLGKEITLRGTGGAGVTSLEAADYGKSVVTMVAGEGANTLLAGFTVTGSGGILISDADPTIEACEVKPNTASTSSSLYAVRSHVTIRDSAFSENGNGQGIALQDAEALVERCTVDHNHWEGMRLTGGAATIRDCDFISNGSPGIRCLGGTMLVERCRFMGHHDGGIGIDDSSRAVIRHCEFLRNKAGIGSGGVSGAARIDACRFIENETDWGGAAIRSPGNPTNPALITNCEFVRNRAASDTWPWFGGGAVWIQGPATVANCTFVDNNANRGEALSIGSGVQVVGNVFRNFDTESSGPLIYADVSDADPMPVLSHNDIQGSGGSANWDESLGTDGGGNIDADPMFIDPAEDNYRLAADSPCIDAGDNDAIAGFDDDLAGNPRIYHDVVDMGAYEFIPPPTEVDIVVHPRGRTDLLELHDHGHLPLAALSSESFDALTIDPATVELSGASVVRRGKSAQYLVQKQDVNRDGRTDLVLYFDQADVATDGGVLTLTGSTFDGTRIVGTDTIKTTNRRGG